MLARRILFAKGLLNGICGPAFPGSCSVAAILNSSFKYTSMKFLPEVLNSSCICSPVYYQWNCKLYTTESVTPFGNSGTTDLLLKQLHVASTTDQILEIVAHHHAVMNNQHIMKALTALFNIEKSEGSIFSSSRFVYQDDFCLLCSLIQKRARFMGSNDVVTSVKCLSFFGIQSTTTVMQTLLQLLRKHINEYSLAEICFIGFLLQKMKDCPLVDALKIALPVLFETHLDMQMNKDDLRSLLSLLQFIDNYKVHENAVIKILDALSAFDGIIDSDSAFTIIRCFPNMKMCDSTIKLYSNALNSLTYSLEGLSNKQLTWLVNRLLSHYLDHGYNSQKYNENFLCAVAETVMRRELKLVEALSFVRIFVTMGFLNHDILDYVATRLLEKKEDLMLFKNLGSIALELFTSANYKPANIDDIVNLVLEEELLEENQKFRWLILAHSLAFFGHYSEKILAAVFSEEFLKELLTSESFYRRNCGTILDLYLAVVSFKPDYLGPFPPEDLLQEVIKMRMERKVQQSFPLLSALEKGLGGAAYVKTNMWTKFGNYIDYVVVMRRGACPVALNQQTSKADKEEENTFVEDIFFPHGSQRVLILVPPRFWYMNNVDKLKGHHAFRIKCLENQGYNVVTIALHRWQELAHHEKIPYLMQKIKEECEHVENGMSSWGNV